MHANCAACIKNSLNGDPRRVGNTGRQRKRWMDNIKVCGHPCPCQNCLQGPPAGKTGRGSLLNRPSCPPPPSGGQPNRSRDWTELMMTPGEEASGLENANFYLWGLIWWFFQYLRHRGTFFVFVSNFCSSGCGHVGSLFTNEKQNMVGSWHNVHDNFIPFLSTGPMMLPYLGSPFTKDFNCTRFHWYKQTCVDQSHLRVVGMLCFISGDMKQPSLPTPFFCCILGVCFCRSGPFNYISFHKFSPKCFRFLTMFFWSYFCLVGPFNYIKVPITCHLWFNDLWIE